MTRRRLDVALVRRGYAASRQQAQALIEAGAVLVAGALADKAARLVDDGEPLVVDTGARRFVSRGGDKLDAALDAFGIDPSGRRVLDAGASTGGFTDCLLQRGAERVAAVDVGYGQLDARLRSDPRVELHERTNIRDADGDRLGAPFDLVVADLSFISLTTVAAALVSLARPGAALVVLVKPQFEAGRREVNQGRGVVRDPAVRRRTLDQVCSALAGAGASIMGAMASPVLGPAGNAEFLVHARASLGAPGALDAENLARALDDAVRDAPDGGGA
ncbi:MAG: TlyA family RNA methyltransferase [Acidimicrobiales bacterium]